MPSFTAVPIADVLTDFWTKVGDATHSKCIDETVALTDDDTTYVSYISGNDVLKLTITERPAEFVSANTVDFNLRVKSSSTPVLQHTVELQIFESDGTSAITDKQSHLFTSDSYANHSGSFSITGVNTADSWSSAQLHISVVGGTFQAMLLTAVDFDIDYSTSPSGNPWYYFAQQG